MSAATTSPSPETPIWKGRPSQIVNFWTYVWCSLLCWLIVPIFIALAKYLRIRCTTYEMTSQRLRMSTGVFSKTIEELELYRVEDSRVNIPFIYRFFSLGDIILMTSDITTPNVLLHAIKQPLEVRDQIRACVEQQRERKGVRVLDISEASAPRP
ncbi:MAG: PH domain-containing protein [Candidatus Sumerlaeota bacterium]|nr:PH domain-containing protein [Candidatus Sumerlaeota bacterium]